MQLHGNFFDYFIVFWAGVLVSFTPCVYPIVPITASFIAGANAKGTKLMGFVISLVYVLGLAIIYSSLAVFAALTGKVFGQLQNNPGVFIAVANIFLFFGLVMLDVIPLPNFGADIQGRIKIKGLGTVLLFGMASGLIVGPCTAPILGTLLLYVASQQNVLHGASLIFVFSYGVGALLILVGTFGGVLGSLPRSGPWLSRIKQFCGLVLIIAAEYFLIEAGKWLL
jgi:thiol:disulfide interchange protein DsbD